MEALGLGLEALGICARSFAMIYTGKASMDSFKD